MPITRLTLTGIDDRAAIPALNRLFAAHPFLELGLLYSEGRAGTERYPSRETLAVLLDDLHAPLALHVCGKAVFAVLDEAEGDPVRGLIQDPRIGRVQINADLAEYAGATERLDAVLTRIGKRVILQDNEANAAVLPELDARNVEILFDRSGGRGRRPDTWPRPHNGRACGYAGGLRPEDIDQDLVAIERAAHGREVWIDLESGLRDLDGAFSLERAETVCAALARHHAALVCEEGP